MTINQNKTTLVVTLLRVLVGWHFLYEGIVKLYNPDWTAYGYLATAQGPMKPLFNTLLHEGTMPWVDTLNMAALLIVGVTLLLGVFERVGAFIGIGLLALYYLAHPSFPGLPQINVEGNYWFVNKNLIELMVCTLLFYYPTGQYFGINSLKKRKAIKTVEK
ncbi:DoxX family membrane protein [uncultured Croceitalea sp.]|uniref:DoxX family membrane protein n=1 Tax=uncultured Croceitalea sp. TaxID=1798908 RepID=UPI003305B7DF